MPSTAAAAAAAATTTSDITSANTSASTSTTTTAATSTAAANGYLAASELALELRLPDVAAQLLELAAGTSRNAPRFFVTQHLQRYQAASACRSACAMCHVEAIFPRAHSVISAGLWYALCRAVQSPRLRHPYAHWSTAGIKDVHGVFVARMRLAHVGVAVLSGNTEAALRLLKDMSEAPDLRLEGSGSSSGSDAGCRLLAQMLLGDVQYKVNQKGAGVARGGARGSCMHARMCRVSYVAVPPATQPHTATPYRRLAALHWQSSTTGVYCSALARPAHCVRACASASAS
jgi:hypothetical protein